MTKRSPAKAGTGSRAAAWAARRIVDGFDRYFEAFGEITRRSRQRFESRDWLGVQQDARDRLLLYGRVVTEVTADVNGFLGEHVNDAGVWSQMKAIYAEAITPLATAEIAETFFNSVTRRVFTTVGVNPSIEFVDFRFQRLPPTSGRPPYRSYRRRKSTKKLVRKLLAKLPFAVPYQGVDEAVSRIAREIEAHWEVGAAPVPFEAIDVLKSVFYRRKCAYLVGRVRGGDRVMPLVIALVHTDGVRVDAVLVAETDVSILFSFTRSYFHADVEWPADVIQFLQSFLPLKPVSELYTALGYNKHGKTELYRDLQRHIMRSDDRFDFAPGARGMVMVVFTMPGLGVVFKVIRDRFVYPKKTTRAEVMRRYQLVFRHDRAGRLVDAQEYEYLAFARERFSESLLEELLAVASHSVTLRGDEVVIKHLYAERRVRPLDLYLREADTRASRRAALDYGQAIRDLAATNIFPGDLLTKNFGVTRHGRVIFYDYDELCLLSECVFRTIPEATNPEDEFSAEPWFYVGPDDVFPEEFVSVLGLSGPSRAAFLERHGCIFDADFWCDLQDRNKGGEVLDIFPYSSDCRISYDVAAG